MYPESKKLLTDTLALAQENNRILRSLKRSMVWGRAIHVVYWALIIGSAIGAYYFIQPFIDQIIGVYGGAKDSFNNVNSLFGN